MENKFINQHIIEAKKIFNLYKGDEPLHLFLKKQFKKNKKFGSKDRKFIAQYLYAVYRTGKENRHLKFEELVFIALFLKNENEKQFFENHFTVLVEAIDFSLDKKLIFLAEKFEWRNTYRAQDEISNEINSIDYRNSFYDEPNVFIRLRKNEKILKQNLKSFGKEIRENCFSFSKKINLETLIPPSDFVVQDYNSQRCAEFFPELKSSDLVWDCCAGSGGKSILLLDKFKNIKVYVSDIRENILESLISRFELLKLKAEKILLINVNKEKDLALLEENFNFVICDVPCTGSGTWARTPEQFYFFQKKEIENFAKRQLDILQNASVKVLPNGHLLYITCSVFEKENEIVIDKFLKENKKFKIIKQDYLNSFELKADTLFACLLERVE
ncbi:MAG: hypothetical protein KA275_05005 [Chitinophagaceae bacterium]|nr:hypothetical protein [Chitinophagaceae bacterium]